jgi:hypothetical protein
VGAVESTAGADWLHASAHQSSAALGTGLIAIGDQTGVVDRTAVSGADAQAGDADAGYLMLNIEEDKMSSLVRSALKHWGPGLSALAVAAYVLMLTPHRSAASVTLDHFKAEWKDASQTVIISWKTATELNVTGFIVQRSTSSGGGFVDITGVIPPVGDQLGGGTYGPVADDPLNLMTGVTYWYRLVVTHSNGSNDNILPVAVQAGVIWRKICLPVIVRH